MAGNGELVRSVRSGMESSAPQRTAIERVETLVEVLRARAAADGDRNGFVFLSYRGGTAPEEVRLSYGALWNRGRAIAAALQARLARGDRVLILCPPGLDYICAFFGCQLAGMVAVPSYPPRNAKHMGRLEAIFEDAGASAILAPSDLSGRLAGWRGTAGELPPLIAVDAIGPEAAGDWVDPKVRADDLSFLQYTSGTTGRPKGVMVSHQSLLINLQAIQTLAGPEHIAVSWLPPFHDMGLVGCILFPVYAGFTIVLMAPEAFLQRPLRWLEAITDYRGTITAAPNFAYQLCVEGAAAETAARLDLSSLRYALNGAEPSRYGTLAAFARAFRHSGFRPEAFVPVYVMAEAVLLASGTARRTPTPALSLDPVALSADCVVVRDRILAGVPDCGGQQSAGLGDEGRAAVSCGHVIAGHDLLIVDPESCAPVVDGRVGEIWLSGPSVASGYWNRPEETEAVFEARLSGDQAGTAYLRTGDLGALVDGELYVLGRIKEMIIIRGRNHYAQDLEATAAASDPLLGNDRTIAFGVEAAGEERVVLVHELTRAALRVLDADATASAMRRAVLGAHEIDVSAIVFVKPATLPRTTSGKLQRSRARDQFLTGKLTAVAEWPVADGRSEASAVAGSEEIVRSAPSGMESKQGSAAASEAAGSTTHLLRDVIAELTAMPSASIGPSTQLDTLGLDSLKANRLVARLSETTGRELELSSVFEASTVAELAAALEASGGESTSPIAPADRSLPVPLSYQQERLWFLDRLDGAAGAAYHIVGALRLAGPLDVPALAGALESVVARHESLRTRFAADGGGPVQVIAAPEASGFALALQDASALGAAALEDRVASLTSAPFDLERGPLFRATLLAVGPEDHVLVVGGHHAVLDGWSAGLLLKEVSALYGARLTGAAASLPDLPVHYADYAAWQRDVLSGERLAAETSWWSDQLQGAPEAISLPFDRARPAVMDYRGGSVRVQVPQNVTAGLRALARSEGASLFMVLEAAFAALLSRVGGDEDLVIGTAVAGRRRVELEALAGFFVNTVALRHRIDGQASFREFLSEAKRVVLAAFEHDAVPFEAVVEAVRPVRSLGHAPLLQVMLVLQNTPDAAATLDLAGVTATPFAAAEDRAQFELSLDLRETADGLRGTLSYASQLFDRATAERLAAIYGRLLAAVAAAPETAVAELPLLDAEERRLVIERFNDTAAAYPRDETVVDLFCAQAARSPDSAAVVDGDRELTYGALDAASNRLARHLVGLGVGPETAVGVCLERSAELIVAILGILKAGAAYVPLDPDYPAERLALMVEDSSCRLVLANEITRKAIAGLAEDTKGESAGLDGGERESFSSTSDIQNTAVKLVVLDEAATGAGIAALSEAPLAAVESVAGLPPQALAFVTFTSGSTGRPKAIGTTHSGLLNFVQWLRGLVGPQGPVRSLLRTSPSFDAINREIWLPLLWGGAVGIPERGEDSSFLAIENHIDRLSPDFLSLVPTILKDLNERGKLTELPGDGFLYSSGEILPSELVDHVFRAQPDLRLFNGYGPSETTMNATGRLCQPSEDLQTPNIGAPIANMRVYVLDRRLEPQPVGVAGELLIGGVQVSRGYLGRAGLTSEKFIADPFSGEAGARLYRTGDLARWRADGTLEFLGRMDHQVKIRGMRVELGEIEAALTDCDGVAQAVVTAPCSEDGEVRLLAYVVPQEVPDELLAQSLGIEAAALTEAQRAGAHAVTLEGLLDLGALRGALKRRLPDHMVPSGFVGLSRLPLTASGKIDRKALPEVDASLQRAPYEAPRSEAERLVAAAFAALLGVADPSVHDSFFDLGGHSLLAVRLVAWLEAETGKALPIRSVFEAPTVAGLAAALGDRRSSDYHPLLRFAGQAGARSARGEAPPGRLYCVHPAAGQAAMYRRLVTPLSQEAEIVGVQSRGVVPGEAGFASYQDMIDAYVSAIRAEACDRPTTLLGWSLGGLIAHDIACRLSDEGREINGLIILDSVELRLRAEDREDMARLKRHRDFKRWIVEMAGELCPASARDTAEGLDGPLRLLAQEAVRSGLLQANELPDDPRVIERFFRVWHGNSSLLEERPASRFFPGPALVLRAADTKCRIADPALGWSRHCASVDSLDLAFGHYELMTNESAAKVAQIVRVWLRQRQRVTPSLARLDISDRPRFAQRSKVAAY